MPFLKSTILALAILAIPASSQGSIIADFSQDFSTGANPNGAWSYGRSAAPGGTMTLLTATAFSSGGELAVWIGPGGYPDVGVNTTNSPYTGGSVTVGPGQGLLHPGPSGEYAVVRYELQAAATATLDLMLEGIDSHPTTTDFHLLKNGVEVFGGIIASFQNVQSFSQTYSFSSGDVIELAVGYGTNNDYTFDSTGFYLTLSDAVPEPGAMSLGLAGLLMTGLFRRFRR